MSTYIHHEIFLLIQSVFTGAILFFCYDLFKALRKVFPHCTWAVSMEDVFYWILCAFFIFAGVYRRNQGILRFFIICGILTGAGICRLTIGDIPEKIMICIFKIPAAVLKKITKWLLFPVRRCKLSLYKHIKKGRMAHWVILRRKKEKRK